MAYGFIRRNGNDTISRIILSFRYDMAIDSTGSMDKVSI